MAIGVLRSSARAGGLGSPERRRGAGVQSGGSSAPATRSPTGGAPVDIAADDPVLAYFREHPGVADLASLTIDSPGVRALREAGTVLVVPLVAQGELIGLLNLGPRRSDQHYSVDDRRLLENLAGQAAPTLRVAQLVRQQEAEARRMERYEQELRVATLIQQNFLPREIPRYAGWHLEAYYRPAREVGGDFYDFVELPDGRLGVVVADVTDKGVPAALVMASTRSVLRMAARRLIEPHAVLARVNEELREEMPAKMFVTCLYGVLEHETGRFTFGNAGHNLPCLKRGEEAVEAVAVGMPLGLLPGMVYEETELWVRPGEALVMFSDGLPEAHAPIGDMFGFPRVLETLARTHSAAIIPGLLDELEAFCAPGWEQEDDITLVAIGRAVGEGATRRARGPDDVVSGAGRVRAELGVASRPGNERTVVDRVAALAREAGLPDGRVERLCSAVAEAVMNAIEHGNRRDPLLQTVVQVLTTDRWLVVRIGDESGDYSPLRAAERPDLDAKLRGEQGPGGWGLFLINEMVDDMDVFSEGPGKIVELRMRLPGADAGRGPGKADR